MSYVNIDECEKAGLDIKKVEAIARKLSKAALDAKKSDYLYSGVQALAN